jgi:hypothetical protein
LGQDAKQPNRVLFSHWNGLTSARDQRFRREPTGRLYDLVNDPRQTTDVATDHPAVAKRLGDATAEWRKDVLGELPKGDPRPFPVGYAEFPRAVLPARDGVPHGGVKRSAGAPNCSFFTNWTKPDDSMTWEIDVHTAGRFEAIVHYTCPKADVGSTVELSLGNVKWTGAVTESNDPPLRGKEHDRVPRAGESYVKDFRPLSLGVVELPAGKGTLTLRATKVPGAQVADVRQIELILVEGKK